MAGTCGFPTANFMRTTTVSGSYVQNIAKEFIDYGTEETRSVVKEYDLAPYAQQLKKNPDTVLPSPNELMTRINCQRAELAKPARWFALPKNSPLKNTEFVNGVAAMTLAGSALATGASLVQFAGMPLWDQVIGSALIGAPISVAGGLFMTTLALSDVLKNRREVFAERVRQVETLKMDEALARAVQGDSETESVLLKLFAEDQGTLDRFFKNEVNGRVTDVATRLEKLHQDASAARDTVVWAYQEKDKLNLYLERIESLQRNFTAYSKQTTHSYPDNAALWAHQAELGIAEILPLREKLKTMAESGVRELERSFVEKEIEARVKMVWVAMTKALELIDNANGDINTWRTELASPVKAA